MNALRGLTRGLVWALLRLYPADFRRRFQPLILRDLDADLERTASLAALVRVMRRSLLDTARGIIPEQFGRQSRHAERAGVAPGIASDLRIAVRRLTSQPAASLLVVGTLGLAIGASTAMFSVIDAVLLRQLPLPGADRLVRIDEQTTSRGPMGLSFPMADVLAREAPSLGALAIYESHTALVVLNDEADRLTGASVSRNFLDVVGVQPAAGRGFTPEPRFGPPDEVVISHRLWQRLGGEASVIGRSLFVDPRQYRIVGVMPAGFAYPTDHHFWTTLPKEMDRISAARDLRFLTGIGRLRPDATLDTLHGELSLLAGRYPATDRIGGPVTLGAVDLKDSIVGSIRWGIGAVAGAAALLLLIACANVSAVLVARSTLRRHEMGIQAALGASRGRLVRQGAIEVAMLALAAGGLGAAAAAACRNVIVVLSRDEIPRIDAVSVDIRTLGFAFAATAVVAMLTTVLPAWLSSRTDAVEGLRTARGQRHAAGTLPVLRVLVVAEVALTVVLVISGLLLGRTLYRLSSVDRGFSGGQVVAMRIHLPLAPRLTDAAQLAFYEDAASRARAVPGVGAVAFSSRLPLSNALASSEVRAIDDPANEVKAVLNQAGPGYFATIGAPIVAGTDLPDSPGQPAAVINEVLARQLFGDGAAIGRMVRIRFLTRPVEAVVVGVSRPIRYNGLAVAPLPEVYLDYRNRPLIMHLFARVDGDVARLLPALKAAVLAADPTRRVTLDPITTLDREVARTLARPRFFLALVATFGSVALVLAAGGLYGVLSFAVAQRRHELGVRLALGASGRDVFRHVVGSGATLTAVGMILGVAGAAATSRLLGSLLYGIAPWDRGSFMTALALTAGVSLLASWIPGRRAQRTDPLTVLRD